MQDAEELFKDVSPVINARVHPLGQGGSSLVSSNSSISPPLILNDALESLHYKVMNRLMFERDTLFPSDPNAPKSDLALVLVLLAIAEGRIEEAKRLLGKYRESSRVSDSSSRIQTDSPEIQLDYLTIYLDFFVANGKLRDPLVYANEMRNLANVSLARAGRYLEHPSRFFL